MPRCICLLTDLLSEPFDEGMNVFARHLAQYLQRYPPVHLLTNARHPPRDLPVEKIPFGKSLLHVPLIRRLRRLKPEILLYLPCASLTPASFLRLAVLRTLLPQTRLAAFCLQPKPVPFWAGPLIRRRPPVTIFEQTAASLGTWQRLGIPAHRILAGVDTRRFVPADPARRLQLRVRHGLDPSAFLVGHVGHLQPSRNLAALVPLLNQPRTQVLIVASSPARSLPALAQDLRRRGVMVWENYADPIPEVYQMLDGYVFPVTDPGGAIGIPLSLLEALACGVPVASTSFGDLPSLFPPGSGVLFADTVADLPARVTDLRTQAGLREAARRTSERFSWERVFEVVDRFLDEART